ncbi:MAG: hypothetical protein KJP04_00060 [Arenicella sp.]|nr:hypothetical protein [Arenicella sp.]
MTILIQLLEIITLRRRPQDLQYDEIAAAFYVVLTIGLGYLTNVIAEQYSAPLAYSLTQNGALALGLFGVLALNGKRVRFVQTCTAVFGVSALLGILTLAIVYIPGLAILTLLISGWGLYIMVLIMREALECSTLRALFIIIGIQIFSVIVLLLLFPDFLTELQSLLVVAQSESEA